MCYILYKQANLKELPFQNVDVMNIHRLPPCKEMLACSMCSTFGTLGV
jgi:hypothetical protein